MDPLMNPRERYLAVTHFGDPDRPFLSFEGMWPETEERWRREGWNGAPVGDIFNLDPILGIDIPVGPFPPFKSRTISENPKTRTYVDADGVVRREFKGRRSRSSMPQFVRFPVENEEDFWRLASTRLCPKLEERFPGDWECKVEKWKQRDSPLMCFANRWGGFFGPLRNLLGLKGLCRAFHETPDFVEAMMDQRVEVLLAILGKVLKSVQLDAFGFWEDMAYRNGPLISPSMFREFMVPRYREVCNFLRSRGVDLICVDSDGDVNQLIPLWLEAGVKGVWPLEVQAGMDVKDLRARYPSLVMFGGIDKRALARGKKEIKREVDRIWPVVETGGYIPHADHWLPPDVSWRNFCIYRTYLARKAGVNVKSRSTRS